MSTQPSSSYHLVLTTLSQHLSKNELGQLVFACGDVLSESEQESIQTGIDLFKLLKHKSKISSGNFDFLRKRLNVIGRLDLARLLPSSLDVLLNGVSTTSHFGGFKEFTYDLSVHELNTQAPPSVAFRMVLLRIADQLTDKNVRNLTFLCSGIGGISESSTPTELFLLLQKVGLLGPDNCAFIIECLNRIGRLDLVDILTSLPRLPLVPRKFNASHQLLALKYRTLLQRRNKSYTLHLSTLQTLLDGDYSVIHKLVIPLALRLNDCCSYQAVSTLSANLRTSLQEDCVRSVFGSVVETTLCMTFDLLHSYCSGLEHILNSPEISISVLKDKFERCQKLFKKFDNSVHQIQWNREVRDNAYREEDKRLTPIGTPALNACSYIYDACSELYGGEKLAHENKTIDSKLFALECCHYIYCYRIVMLEWLATLTYLADSVSLDLNEHRHTLIKILEKHSEQITQLYPTLRRVLDPGLHSDLTPILVSAGIDVSDERIGTSEMSLNFLHIVRLPSYAFLLQLTAMSFLGGGRVSMESTSARVKIVLDRYYITEMYVSECLDITRNVVTLFRHLVSVFRQRTLQLNSLCAPLVEQLTEH